MFFRLSDDSPLADLTPPDLNWAVRAMKIAAAFDKMGVLGKSSLKIKMRQLPPCPAVSGGFSSR
jgi:hypothetical protein